MAQVSSGPPITGLDDFEGSPVGQVAIKITKAGDGLSDALKVRPVALHRHDEVFFVLRGVVGPITFKDVSPLSDDVCRVHTIVTLDIVEVDKDQVDELLKHAKDTIRRKMEEASGVVPLFDESAGDEVVPFEDLTDEQQALWVGHSSGGHADGPVEGCPRCIAPPVRDATPAKRAPGRPRGSKNAAK